MRQPTSVATSRPKPRIAHRSPWPVAGMVLGPRLPAAAPALAPAPPGRAGAPGVKSNVGVDVAAVELRRGVTAALVHDDEPRLGAEPPAGDVLRVLTVVARGQAAAAVGQRGEVDVDLVRAAGAGDRRAGEIERRVVLPA